MRRTVLLLLALGWGWLVQGVYQGLSYEHATGYPPVVKSYGVAFLAALPLLLGVFIAENRNERFKYLRWLGILWLGVQAAFLLILSWMKLFGLIPLLGFAVLLVAELEEPKQPGDAVKPLFWQGPILTVLLLCGLLYWWHVNPLPSDEKMIAHFYAHRAEIEELVKGYRAWEPSAAVPNWYVVPKNKALMEKAGVKRVINIAPHWHPNPYSQEAAKQFWDNMSATTRARGVSSINRYSSIQVELKDAQNPERHFANVLLSTGPHLIFKDLVYFPEVARIDGENIWFAAHPFFGVNAKSRIFPTLNVYPPHWDTGECVYRQFETHWFIRMCVAVV